MLIHSNLELHSLQSVQIHQENKKTYRRQLSQDQSKMAAAEHNNAQANQAAQAVFEVSRRNFPVTWLDEIYFDAKYRNHRTRVKFRVFPVILTNANIKGGLGKK